MDLNSHGDVSAWHLLFALLLAFVFLFLRFLLNTFIFREFAIWLLSAKSISLKDDKLLRSKIEKCTESMWKLTYYATAEFCILKAINHETWFRSTDDYFKGWPNQELTFFRIGSVVLALHDVSDVFMEAAKVFKYSENETGASIFFGFFAISWLLLRLIFFPFWVIHASSYHLLKVLRLSEAYHMSLYYVFNTMLLTLLVFHIYWWILIWRMIMRQLKNRGQVGEDIRSDSEDD